MNRLRLGVLSLPACLIAAALTLGHASASPLNCAVQPYCPQDVVVPPSAVDASGVPVPGATYEILIDIDEPLPYSITFPTANGGVITVVQRISTHTADATLELATTDGKSAALLALSSAKTEPPKGFVVVAQYRTKRKGDGTLTVIHTVREPNAKPYHETIPIHIH